MHHLNVKLDLFFKMGGIHLEEVLKVALFMNDHAYRLSYRVRAIIFYVSIYFIFLHVGFDSYALAPQSVKEEPSKSRGWGSLLPPGPGESMFFDIEPVRAMGTRGQASTESKKPLTLDALFGNRLPPRPFSLEGFTSPSFSQDLPVQHKQFFPGGNYPRVSFGERLEIKRAGFVSKVPHFLKQFEPIIKKAIENYYATGADFENTFIFVTVRQGEAKLHSETGNHWYVNGLRSSINKENFSLPTVYMWTDFMPDQFVTSTVTIGQNMNSDGFLQYLENRTKSGDLRYESMKERILYKLQPGVILRTPFPQIEVERLKTYIKILFYQNPPKEMSNSRAFGYEIYTGATNTAPRSM